MSRTSSTSASSGAAHLMVDAHGLAQQLAHLPSPIAGEVGPHSRGGCGPCRRRAVGPGGLGTRTRPAAGEGLGEAQLADLGMAGDRGQAEEVVEPRDPEPGGPLEQQMEQIACGERAVECPVARLMRQAHAGRQGGQLAVGHLVGHEPAGEGTGVDPPAGGGGETSSAARKKLRS